MQKRNIVRLSKKERELLEETVKELKGTGQKVRRAQVLLKADATGPAWSNSRVVKAFGCCRQTVEGIRQRFVESSVPETLEEKREHSPVENILDGKQEAEVIAMRLGSSPRGLCALDASVACPQGGRFVSAEDVRNRARIG